MRYITTTIAPIKYGESVELGVREFIAYLINTDGKFNRDGQGVRSGFRIEQAVSESKDKPVIALEEADWQRLREAAEGPSNGYPVSPARAASPFLDAIEKAPDKAPESAPAEAPTPVASA